eukprot:TRINITY_DN2707_c0_g6_i1.p1 TRINITY_DN2707_c0_g6~~TRINITY_DN2707_c0_g6_i1.p1  ORF type:complete len:352 (+),score=67.46 TRINITY_DN2707_c0_g6_i1:54-1058(+)
MPFLKKTAMVVSGTGVGVASWLRWCWKSPTQHYAADVKYESLVAEEKAKLLWTRCAEDTTPSTYPGTKDLLFDFLLAQNFHATMWYESDEMHPKTKKKNIHTIGGVCAGVFESSGDHDYTGVFASKSNPIIFRMSYGEKQSRAAVPGIAVKFLRTGVPSANIMAMKDLNGVQTGNFFATPLRNHIHKTENFLFKMIEQKFAYFSPHARMLGLSEFGTATVDGKPVEKKDVVFPFCLLFEPNPELAEKPEWKNLNWDYPMEELFPHVPAGTMLYTISAFAEPGAPAKKIGVIKSTTPIISSKYGDEKLFFKHIRMDADLELRPEWNKGADEWMSA